VGQVDIRGNVVPVYSSLDALPEPIEEAKRIQQKATGKRGNVIPQFGGLSDLATERRPVGALAMAPDLIRRLHNNTELTAPGGLRSLATYIRTCNEKDPEYAL
jgi:hypothetical protein